MKQIPVALLTLVAGVLVTVASYWVGQNFSVLLPEQASEQAPLVDNLFKVMMIIGTGLFIVVEGAIVIFAIAFRQKAGDNTDGPHLEGNVPLEIFWTLIPTVIVIGLGVYSVDVYESMGGLSVGGGGHSHGSMVKMASSQPVARLVSDTGEMPSEMPSGSAPEIKRSIYGFGATPAEGDNEPDVVVNVTGVQYAWLFEYPGTNLTTGELHIPINADVQLNLAATDVIHSFWVPQFRLKQDAIPGQKTQLRFRAIKAGTYPVVCAELCGGYHGGMRTTVTVEDDIAYSQWLKDSQVALGSEGPTIALNPEPASQIAHHHIHDMGVTAEALKQLKSATAPS